MAFFAKFFPMGKTNALRLRIFNFQQTVTESILEAWERLQDYIQACPHHGIENWLVHQNFYDGLTNMSRRHIDVAAGGAFLSLTIDEATTLINKMVSNQSWGRKKITKRYAYHEGDGYVCRKNRSFDENTGGTGPRQRSNEGHRPGLGLTHDM